MLLLINPCYPKSYPLHQVSIHLMLLLINVMGIFSYRKRGFNTSHVTINLSCWPANLRPPICFNTSHVTINREYRKNYVSSGKVSIHLMLLLISFAPSKSLVFTSFNTSHVTINLKQPRCPFVIYIVSIHLMLLLIQSERPFLHKLNPVSIHLMLLLIHQKYNF